LIDIHKLQTSNSACDQHGLLNKTLILILIRVPYHFVIYKESELTYGWMGEDHRGNVFVVQLEVGLVVEEAVGQLPSGSNGN
jgi:hypothetical protein